MNAEKIAFRKKLPPIRYSLVEIHRVLKNYNPVDFLLLQTFSSFLKWIFKLKKMKFSTSILINNQSAFHKESQIKIERVG